MKADVAVEDELDERSSPRSSPSRGMSPALAGVPVRRQRRRGVGPRDGRTEAYPNKVKKIRSRYEEWERFPDQEIPSNRGVDFPGWIVVEKASDDECYVGRYVVEFEDEGQAL